MRMNEGENMEISGHLHHINLGNDSEQHKTNERNEHQLGRSHTLSLFPHLHIHIHPPRLQYSIKPYHHQNMKREKGKERQQTDE